MCLKLTKKLVKKLTKRETIIKIITQKYTLRNTIGRIRQMLHWNQGNYPISEVRPVTENGHSPNPPSRQKRSKLNSVAPSASSNNIRSICNNSTVCDHDSEEEKNTKNLKHDESLHI